MALQTKLNWVLYIGENEPIHLNEDLLEYSHSENLVGQTAESFYLPQLLQEIYYVDQLNRNVNIEGSKYSIIDSIYDYIRIYHGRIIELLHSRHTQLDDTSHLDLDAANYNWLMNLSGQKVGQFVEDNLPEPYITRDVAYRIFNLLPKQYKKYLPHTARRNIVASFESFEKYWNKGMSLLSSMQSDIHTLGVNDLKELLSELTMKNNDFKERYLDDSGGCFSLTRVRKNAKEEDVLCFSGQKFSGLNSAIDKIAQSGYFVNPTVIRECLNVRYYLCPEKYVTFAEAMQTHKDHKRRMFSCCERKTFAKYDWQGVDSFIMTVKYYPCELCQWSVDMHKRKYGGTIRVGVKQPPLKDKALYDVIAEEIYEEIHG